MNEYEVQRGLDLPDTLPLSEDEEQAIIDRWDTKGSAREELLAMGILAREEPSSPLRPITAEDLTNYSPQRHAELHALYLSWYSYLASELAYTKLDLLQVDNTVKAVRRALKKSIRRESRGQKITQDELNELVDTDPKLEVLMIDQQKLQQVKEVVSMNFEILEKNMRVISREIEVTKIDAVNSGVSANVAARRGAAVGAMAARNRGRTW